jgi:hypothetical protein
MSYRFIPGFIVRVSDQSRHNHWQGGVPDHEGADCERCQKPLLLLWDINCSDPRFVVDGRRVFKDLQRLPLYYCWTCVADLAYQVVDNKRIHFLLNNGSVQGPDFPYVKYPLNFDRHPIELSRPDDAPQIVRDFFNDAPEETSTSTRAALSEWLRRPIRDEFDIWWQQFGGEPWLVQGEEQLTCPNLQCAAASDGRNMKILARICNDPTFGLPMIETSEDVERSHGVVNRWVQVVYHICEQCLTIRAFNRCD